MAVDVARGAGDREARSDGCKSRRRYRGFDSHEAIRDNADAPCGSRDRPLLRRERRSELLRSSSVVRLRTDSLAGAGRRVRHRAITWKSWVRFPPGPPRHVRPHLLAP